jgi:S-adenosyl-L-methionine hydrolase (adenosine-forming)
VFVTFLSDFGLQDDFVGTCHGVIKRIAPEAQVIDITHGIEPQAVLQGALVLAKTLPYIPEGVHLAVVDPGVGTERRAVAARAEADDRILVGPDNGLLWPAIEAFGGAVESVDLARSPFRLEPVSATFHGRDVFAPVAARLALGVALPEAGEPIDPGSLVRLELPAARVDGDRVVAEVLHIDGFGNATLALRAEELPEGRLTPGTAFAVEVGGRSHAVTAARTFGDVDEGALLVYEGSSRRVTVAANGRSAAEALAIAAGDRVVLGSAR